MSKKIDWDKRLKELKESFKNAKPNDTYGKLTEAARVTIKIKIEESQWQRLGFLESEVWVLKTQEEPCKEEEKEIVNNREVTVTLTEEQIKTYASSISSSISKTLGSKITSSITSTVGIPEVSSLEASIGSEISAERTLGKVSTKSIEVAIRNAISRSEKLSIPKAPKCKKIKAPYGLELVATVTGEVSFFREFKMDLSQGFVPTEFSNTFTQLSTKIDVQVSLDAKVSAEKTTITPATKCEKCPKKGRKISYRLDKISIQSRGIGSDWVFDINIGGTGVKLDKPKLKSGEKPNQIDQAVHEQKIPDGVTKLKIPVVIGITELDPKYNDEGYGGGFIEINLADKKGTAIIPGFATAYKADTGSATFKFHFSWAVTE